MHFFLLRLRPSSNESCSAPTELKKRYRMKSKPNKLQQSKSHSIIIALLPRIFNDIFEIRLMIANEREDRDREKNNKKNIFIVIYL